MADTMKKSDGRREVKSKAERSFVFANERATEEEKTASDV
jgi:hypothetical protein